MSAIEFKKETSDSPVCSSEGTSALDSASQTKTLSGKKLSKKHGRKKNSRTAALRHNTTETNIRIIDLQSGIESSVQNDESADAKEPEKTDPIPAEQPSPTSRSSEYEEAADEESLYMPAGAEYVKTDSELPQADNRRTLPDSSGILYEIAEELYRKEKTASEIEALCQPPFKKVFDEKQIERLDRQVKKDTLRLVASAKEDSVRTPVKDSVPNEEKPISTAKALIVQFLLFVPVINIAAAFIFSFKKGINKSIRAYGRGFLIWLACFMTGALVWFAAVYFTNPANYASLLNLVSAIQIINPLS